MVRYCILFLLITGLAALGVNARSQDKPTAQAASKTNVQVLMRDKLTHMQKVLDGLVTDDFEKIAEEAEMLRILGRAASWQAIDTKEYKTHSRRYARLTSNLAAAGKRRNRDAALLQYLQLNVTCVDCHEYIRKQQHPLDPTLNRLER